MTEVVVSQSLPMPTAVVGVEFTPPPFLYEYLFPHDISKTYAARITELDVEMF